MNKKLNFKGLSTAWLLSQDGYNPQEYVPNVIERIRANVLGLESTEPLDLVQLHWWDVQVRMRNE